jgi:hypothetical protein
MAYGDLKPSNIVLINNEKLKNKKYWKNHIMEENEDKIDEFLLGDIFQIKLIDIAGCCVMKNI